MSDEISLEIEVSWPAGDAGNADDLAALNYAKSLALTFVPATHKASLNGLVLAREWKMSKKIATFEKHFEEGFLANSRQRSGSLSFEYSEFSRIRVSADRRRPSWGVEEFCLGINWTFGDIFSPTEPHLSTVMFGAFSKLATRNQAIWGNAEVVHLGPRQPLAAQPNSGQVAGVSEGQVMSVELFKQFPPSVIRFSETYETDQGQRVCCLLDLSADKGIATQLLQQFSAHHRPIE